jgi:hypothetical protein
VKRRKFRNQKVSWQKRVFNILYSPNTILILVVILIVVTMLIQFKSKAVEVVNTPIQGVKELITETIYKPVSSTPAPTKKMTAEEKAERDKFIKEELARVAESLRQKERDEELARLSNPQIIAKELSKVGKLITYESKVGYTDKVSEKSFWGTKTVHIDLTFRFGISFELSKLKVAEIIDDMAIIQIPMDAAILEYIEIVDEVIINGEKSLLVDHFTPDETSAIIVNAQRKTVERIENTDEIYTEAVRQLKVCLTELIGKLGYKRVVFDTV